MPDSPDGTAGRLAALLADIRSRHYPVPDPSARCAVHAPQQICESDRHWWPCHAHMLAGIADLRAEAVEAALKVAGGWAGDAGQLDAASSVAATPLKATVLSVRAQALDECARELRDAISRALSGEEEADRGRS